MRVILIANVIINGGARRPGYVVDDYADICEPLIARGLAKLIVAEAQPPAVAEPSEDIEIIEQEPETAAKAAEAPASVEAPRETKAQRKAREKAETAAKAAEADHSDPREG